MANLTMPRINIYFREAAAQAVARSGGGVAALILKDASHSTKEEGYELTSPGQCPEKLDAANKKAVDRAFLGFPGGGRPKKLLLYVCGSKALALSKESAALKWLALRRFDYLAAYDGLTAEEANVLKDFVLGQRQNNGQTCRAVLPNLAGDSEAIINFAGDKLVVDGTTYSTAAYCGRIAGLLAATPRTMSATYAALPEVQDVARLTSLEMDTAVGAGKLICWYDGEKVKLGRGVNSLTTIAPPKTEDWKKIRIMETADMVASDIRRTCGDRYIGKVANTYDNKMSLVTAIREYLGALEREGLIAPGWACDIDTAAQSKWLQEHGEATSSLSEAELRQADTGSYVFLFVCIRPVDAMEDIEIPITML